MLVEVWKNEEETEDRPGLYTWLELIVTNMRQSDMEIPTIA